MDSNFQQPPTVPAAVPQPTTPAPAAPAVVSAPQVSPPVVSPPIAVAPQQNTQPLPSPAPAPTNTAPTSNPASEIQDAMRKRILKIIVILTSVSVVSVLGIFLLSGAADSSISELETADNRRATYSVPTTWGADTVGSGTSYINGDSAVSSQANLVVITPTKLTFDSELISSAEITSFLREYENIAAEAGTGLSFENRREVELEGFNKVYDYDIAGTASDGVTQILGISRLMFDNENYIHTVEFIAVANYWTSNEEAILAIVDSYKLKEGN